ncbi:hypothetical protein U0X36_05450 [Bacillus thuringiensis]|uniref:hypothetical protein n=1 Tax=Bacillus thuringiensis TaxID=1428 RepID=UPI000EE79A0E|nr:hypothetical protein [Bacillus thuringiensis]MDZ3952390.1 hypothetical protein [Bacillus thuringiensis]RGP45216.1 hypothetical protein BTW32_25965 [Bacillus thuringiensis]
MSIIDLVEVKKKRKIEKIMVTIPIIECIFYENGEIEFELSGEQEVPLVWLEKD